MQYQDLCNKIIEGVGGKDNVVDVSHCITRLRFRLKDESKADTAALKATMGVLDVIQAAGQYQHQADVDRLHPCCPRSVTRLILVALRAGLAVMVAATEPVEVMRT